MFERYTEKARRVIFFARYEASQFGSPYIETEHLLLGLLREDRTLTNRFLRSHASVESIRKQIEGHTNIREKTSTAIDLPLTDESKRILKHASDESESLSLKHIGTEHLLVGILCEEKCFAAEILRERGLRLSSIREELARSSQEPSSAKRISLTLSQIDGFSRNLTQEAMDLQLNPLIDRQKEVDAVIEILCSLNNNNPILSGERGVGKTAVIEGLAQRIVDGEVPPLLEDREILAFDFQRIADSIKEPRTFEQRLKAIVKELGDARCIVFIDDLQTALRTGLSSGSQETASILKPALMGSKLQCIGVTTPGEYPKLVQQVPWLAHCSRLVHVLPLSEESAIKVLFGNKERYEKFHGVSYSDDALQSAVYYSRRYIQEGYVLAKAMNVLDTAGARVKLRQTTLPEELTEVQKRIKFIVHRMENAIANHEFEKARFYSDEERKERENLRAIREKYRLDESSTGIVGPEDIEDVVSGWTGVSVTVMRENRATGISSMAQKRRPLRIFLCHASEDKPAVRDLCRRLKENQIDPWLDEENLLAGHRWDHEIGTAVRSSDAVIVCLSTHVRKAGYLQKEIKKVLDVADEQPEDTIYLIPIKLEECEVPHRLQDWHWVNLFEDDGFEKLMRALLERGRALGEGGSSLRHEL